MCRGVEADQGKHGGGCRQLPVAEKDGAAAVVMCELCNSRASLYCQADDAYLCWKCDKWVHAANFLALRHIRCILCNVCQNLTRKYLIGTATELLLPTVLTSTQLNDHCHHNNDNLVNRCCSVKRKRPFVFL